MIEVALAGSILTVLWLGLADAVRGGVRSQEALVQQADRVEELRQASDFLRDDLNGTSAARMSFDLMQGNRCVLELQHPVRVEGVDTWGVRSPGIAAEAATNGEQGWHIRYVADGRHPGAVVPLQRQVVDEEGSVRDRETVAQLGRDEMGLPGFSVETAGEMAAVRISRADDETGVNCKETSLYVRIRN